jgi:TrmH family RNA methyltransferase
MGSIGEVGRNGCYNGLGHRWRVHEGSNVPDLITSAANPLVKRIRGLAERKQRRREGAFFVEGLQPVWQAVEAGATIDTFVVAPDLLVSERAQKLLAAQEAGGTRVAHVTAGIFTSLSDRDGPSGLGAIVRARMAQLEELPVREDAPLVALHRIGNPGNLGTIIRTADATGAGGVILLGETTDPFAPAAVKASMGALFALPVAHVADPAHFFSWATERGIAIATTSARATDEHWAVRYPRPLALLLGSEGDGLPPDLLARGDLRVRIPMTGTARSLNLAVAAGVLLYEIRRQLGQ